MQIIFSVYMPAVVILVVMALAYWLLRREGKRIQAERGHVAQVEHFIRNTGPQSLLDYDMLLSKIHILHKQCRKGSSAYRHIKKLADSTQSDRQRAVRWGYPYATDQQIKHAQDTLGLDDTATPQSLERAYKRALTPYDLEVLKARAAPPEVIETAIKRRAVIRQAHQVLSQVLNNT